MFKPLSRVQGRYRRQTTDDRQTTDGRAMASTERNVVTFGKNVCQQMCELPRISCKLYIAKKPESCGTFLLLSLTVWVWHSGLSVSDAVSFESWYFVWNSAKWQPLQCSRSLKVIDFCINRKCVCDFLLVNTNLHHITHRFQIIVDYWWNFRLKNGITSLPGETLTRLINTSFPTPDMSTH